MYQDTQIQDAVQWAIEQADKAMPRGERSTEEMNHLFNLEQLRNKIESNTGKNANRASSV